MLAQADDLPWLTTLAQQAQARLRERGLAQWVPAAHAPYAAELRAKLAQQSLHKLVLDDQDVAFFDLTPDTSPWWPADAGPAWYLSGVVTDRAWRGHGLGRAIVAHAQHRAQVAALPLRLDCFAGNQWLCQWYRGQGFAERGRVMQAPDYEGALLEWRPG
jgi:GNAT superfamily N-acetyltransferase